LALVAAAVVVDVLVWVYGENVSNVHAGACDVLYVCVFSFEMFHFLQIRFAMHTQFRLKKPAAGR